MAFVAANDIRRPRDRSGRSANDAAGGKA